MSEAVDYDRWLDDQAEQAAIEADHQQRLTARGPERTCPACGRDCWHGDLCDACRRPEEQAS